MSKQELSIRELSGGMSTDMDPSDIADNMAVELDNFNVDYIGRIAPIRGFERRSSLGWDSTYRAYTFNSSAVRSSRMFNVIYGNSNRYHSYDQSLGSSQGTFPLSSIDKVAQQNDRLISYGRNRNLASLIPNGNGFDSRSISRNYSINVNAGGSNTSLPGSGSLRVAVKAVGSSGDGEWMDIITIYVSATLADGSESKLASSSSFYVEGSVSFTVSNNSLPPELDGFKVYYTHQNASDPHRIPDHDGDPLLLMEFKRGEGYRFAWENDFTSGTTSSHSSTSLSPPFTSRFSFISGFNQTDFIIERFSLYKFVNNRGYAFNPTINGEIKDGAIAISPAGLPNVFPETSIIDVTSSGDPYIACEHFNGLLYCFKEHEINIISIASGSPSSFFLSETIPYNGVDSEFAVTVTETGVFWANRNGVFFHTGQKASLVDVSRNRVKKEYSHIASLDSKNISVAYSTKNRKACVMIAETSLSTNNVMYHFDIENGSVGRIPIDGRVNSNLYVIGDLVCFDENVSGSNNRMILLDFSEGSKHAGITSNYNIVTKAYDMGQPSVRKKVRRFYVTFDSFTSVGNINLAYSVDGSSFVTIPSSRRTHVGENDSIVMFDLVRSTTAYKIQLRIWSESNNFPAIKDISIIYRMKLPK